MKRVDLAPVLPWMRRKTWPLRSRVGMTGVLGVGLLLLGAGLAVAQALLHNKAAQALLKLELEAADLGAQAQQVQAARPRGHAETLRALPAVETHLSDLRALFELAARHRLDLERSDLQPTAAPSAAMHAVVLTLPLRGSYASLKGFAGDALKLLPHLALQDLRMERPDIGSSEIRARIRMALYYRGAQP
jgi:hypothetical protein